VSWWEEDRMRRVALIFALYVALTLDVSALVAGFIVFNFPGASGTVARAVNARNDIVGYYSDGTNNHAFWSNAVPSARLTSQAACRA
jgi:hypothetical protein